MHVNTCVGMLDARVRAYVCCIDLLAGSRLCFQCAQAKYLKWLARTACSTCRARSLKESSIQTNSTFACVIQLKCICICCCLGKIDEVSPSTKQFCQTITSDVRPWRSCRPITYSIRACHRIRNWQHANSDISVSLGLSLIHSEQMCSIEQFDV